MWVIKGATLKEIAAKTGVAESTLREMRRKHPALSSAIDIPQGEVNDQVNGRLYKRCLGYDYEEVTRWQTIGRDGEIIWLEKRTIKHLPPDPNSIQFWLINKQPEEWKREPEKKEKEAGEQGVIIIPEVTEQ